MANKLTYTDRLQSYFEAHPQQWIDGLTLSERGGSYGWRSRVSDVRKRGLAIKNRQRSLSSGRIISEYKYVPPEPETPRTLF